MRQRIKLYIAAVAGVLVLAGSAAGIAIATDAGDNEEPLTGTTLEKASAAALAHTGGGQVIETEAGDDGAAYGVEVRLPDGRVLEVNMDEDFTVIGQEEDHDGANDTEGGPDDD
jgi:hypothetical protein